MVVEAVEARPQELQIEGCVIEIVHKSNVPGAPPYVSRGRVLAVRGPYPIDPHTERWLGRPDLGGYTIEFEQLDKHLQYLPSHKRKGWINEVHVVGGLIYAYPWRDEIRVIERPSAMQTRLF